MHFTSNVAALYNKIDVKCLDQHRFSFLYFIITETSHLNTPGLASVQVQESFPVVYLFLSNLRPPDEKQVHVTPAVHVTNLLIQVSSFTSGHIVAHTCLYYVFQGGLLSPDFVAGCVISAKQLLFQSDKHLICFYCRLKSKDLVKMFQEPVIMYGLISML